MDISLYLVELLRLHDCVIIPDLGGFISNYRPAEMDLAGNRFNPPVKEVIFSGKLNKNDGLLVNYISETEGLGYIEARHMISEFVDETWSKLENGDQIEFKHIGTLKFDKNEKLIFEPVVHENFLLEAYGLEGFHFPQLEHEKLIQTKRLFVDKEAVRPVFSSRKVKALAVGVPLLLALLFIPVSKYVRNNNQMTNLQTSSAAPTILNETIKTPSTLKIDSLNSKSPENQIVVKVEPVNTQPSVNQAQPEPVAIKSNSRYRLIGGCFSLRENADKFLEKLRSSGFKSEMKVQPNGTFLVVVQSYTDKAEATLALKNLRETDPATGYWMSAN